MTKNYKGGGSIFENIFNYIFNNIYLLLGFLLSLFGLIIFYLYKIDPLKLIKNFPYTMLGIIGVIFIIFACFFFYIINYKISMNEKSTSINYLTGTTVNKDLLKFFLKVFSLFAIIGSCILIIYGLYWLSQNMGGMQYFLTFFFVCITIIIVLAIINLLIKEFTSSGSAIPSFLKHNAIFYFIKELIFFLPCLLIDFVIYIEKEIGATTKPIWVLLILELVIILLYFLIPFLVKNIMLHDGQLLLEGPIYTNYLTNLGSYQNLAASSKIKYNYNYGLSFKLYINPEPTSTNPSYTKFTSLFNYANKPNILYNAKENILKIIFQNSVNDLVTIYELKDIKYQKWLHFIINYNSGFVDIFIDNYLIASMDGIAPYMTTDKIKCGAINGINGGIKDVYYFTEIIPKDKILLLFNST